MDDTACAAADAAAPEIDDPLAAAAPNPAHLAALAGTLDLAEESRVFDLARAIANPKRGDLVSALLYHELASCHRLMMRFGAMADQFLSHVSPPSTPTGARPATMPSGCAPPLRPSAAAWPG